MSHQQKNGSINQFDARYCRGLPFSQQISAMSSAAESGQKKDKVISGLVIAIKVGLRQEIDVLLPRKSIVMLKSP